MANNKFLTKTNKILLGIIFLIMCSVGVIFSFVIFSSNTTTNKNVYLYINKNDSYTDVVTQLEQMGVLKNTKTFEWLAGIMEYPELVKSGRYQINNNMNNLALVRKLKYGNQTPVKITFNNIRTKEQLAGRLDEQLMIDSVQIIEMFNDSALLKKYDLNDETIVAIFLPNTYEIYWNISPQALFDKMWNEYNKFWNEKRLAKASEIGLTPVEVTILASIVEEETNLNLEKPTVAGLYINRLKKRMLLQADPTVKFAVGDFTITRVLNKHLKTDSPYNTYKYRGLPPGPIRIPAISSIEAVLNYEHHNYLYMCAKEDLSGYHAFSVTHREHQRNAARYQSALNKRNIYR